jgi:hypothetical protein
MSDSMIVEDNSHCFIRNRVPGELPRDDRGEILGNGRKSDGRGALRGKTVEVVRGRKLPIGLVGPVRWHGETKYGWSVGISVENGAALVWTAASNVDVTDKTSADQQALDLSDKGVGDCPF